MATEKLPNISTVKPARLWFGLITSVLAWIALGCTDICIAWLVCEDPLSFGTGMAHPGAKAALICVSVALLTIAIVSGLISYRNWRAISSETHLLHADATNRPEFMALLGVIVTATLGMGIIWLSIPPLMIAICARAR